MRSFVLALVIGASIVAVAATVANGQTPTFPYEAVVDGEDVYFRSGPGRKYYPTGKLQRGTRVTVHRHDPGGWFMIAPPPGSFSWIRTEYVKRGEGNRGTLTENNIVVRVGSAFGEIHDVEQRRLSKGDEVAIVEQKTLQTSRGPVDMFKIKPPSGEYRWVSGQSVVPADKYVEKKATVDPFAGAAGQQPKVNSAGPIASGGSAANSKTGSNNSNSGSGTAERKTTGNGGPFDRPLVRVARDNDAIIDRGPTSEQISADRQALDQLDARFREIIKRDTQQWSFQKLRQDYLQLQNQTQLPGLAGQIDLRLAAVQRYQTIKNEYDAFIRLTSETNKRDSQLLTMQRKVPVPNASLPGSSVRNTPSRPAGRPPSGKIQPIPEPALPRDRTPTTNQAGPTLRPQRNLPRQTAPQRNTTRRPPRFEGAGVIYRSATTFSGAPQHVLLAPNGRILAYLQGGRGVNLDRYLGQAMGLNGRRWHRNDLQSDFMIVDRLTPVRLRP